MKSLAEELGDAWAAGETEPFVARLQKAVADGEITQDGAVAFGDAWATGKPEQFIETSRIFAPIDLQIEQAPAAESLILTDSRPSGGMRGVEKKRLTNTPQVAETPQDALLPVALPPIDKEAMLKQLARYMPDGRAIPSDATLQKLRVRLKGSQGRDAIEAIIALKSGLGDEDIRKQMALNKAFQSAQSVTGRVAVERPNANLVTAAFPDLTAALERPETDALTALVALLQDATGLPGNVVSSTVKQVAQRAGNVGVAPSTWIQRMSTRNIDRDGAERFVNSVLDPSLWVGGALTEAGIMKLAELGRMGKFGKTLGKQAEKLRKYAYGSAEEVTQALPRAAKAGEETAQALVGMEKGVANANAAALLPDASATEKMFAAKEAASANSAYEKLAGAGVRGKDMLLASERLGPKIARDMIQMAPQAAKDFAYQVTVDSEDAGLAQGTAALLGMVLGSALLRGTQTGLASVFAKKGTLSNNSTQQGLSSKLISGGPEQYIKELMSRGYTPNDFAVDASGGIASRADDFINNEIGKWSNQLDALMKNEALDATLVLEAIDKQASALEELGSLAEGAAPAIRKLHTELKTKWNKSDPITGSNKTEVGARELRDYITYTRKKAFDSTKPQEVKDAFRDVRGVLKELINNPALIGNSKLTAEEQKTVRELFAKMSEGYRFAETLEKFVQPGMTAIEKADGNAAMTRAVTEAVRTGKLEPSLEYLAAQDYIYGLLKAHNPNFDVSKEQKALYAIWDKPVRDWFAKAAAGNSRFAVRLREGLISKDGFDLAGKTVGGLAKLASAAASIMRMPLKGAGVKSAENFPELVLSIANDPELSLKSAEDIVKGFSGSIAEENWIASYKKKSEDVNDKGLTSSASKAADKAAAAWENLFGSQMVMNSAKDGTHADGSKHYAGEAFDVSVKGISDEAKIQEAVAKMQAAVGSDYSVTYETEAEAGKGFTGNHIHVQKNSLADKAKSAVKQGAGLILEKMQ